MTAYYNEFDPKAAAWLRELIRQGHIAPGDVDERSIEDVTPNDLRHYTQCHFFAGIGVWSYALRRAGWSDDRRVWTGSCPCQPFSSAGKGDGFADERHLWPHFHHLIRQCGPAVVFGEQVASKDGLAWLDLVQTDLEGTGYAVGAVDTCAAGFGAPHIRQRLYWCANGLADATREQHDRPRGGRSGRRPEHPDGGGAFGLADGGGGGAGLEGQPGHGDRGGEPGRLLPEQAGHAGACGELGGLGHPGGAAGERNSGALSGTEAREHGTGFGLDGGELVGPEHAGAGLGRRQPGPTNGHWGTADWLFCRDGKWRPVEPGAFPLAHGAAARVGRLRGYGNAIVPQVAAEVIAAYLETQEPRP